MRIRKVYAFSVLGEPAAQPRHKVGKFGAYIPKGNPIHSWKEHVTLTVRNHIPVPLLGNIRCDLQFYFSRPVKMRFKKKEMVAVPHAGKPDLDNLVKAMFDAMNSWAWKDDAQVYSLVTTKFYTAAEFTERGVYCEHPRVIILIEEHE